MPNTHQSITYLQKNDFDIQPIFKIKNGRPLIYYKNKPLLTEIC